MPGGLAASDVHAVQRAACSSFAESERSCSNCDAARISPGEFGAARGCGIPTPPGTRLPRRARGTLPRRERRSSTALRTAASRPWHRPRCRRRCPHRARTARAHFPARVRARESDVAREPRFPPCKGIGDLLQQRIAPRTLVRPDERSRAARSRARRSASVGSGGLLGNSSHSASSGPSPVCGCSENSLSTSAEESGPSCLRNHASAGDAPFAARKALHALNWTLRVLSGGTFWLSSAYSSKACAAAPTFAMGGPSSRTDRGLDAALEQRFDRAFHIGGGAAAEYIRESFADLTEVPVRECGGRVREDVRRTRVVTNPPRTSAMSAAVSACGWRAR